MATLAAVGAAIVIPWKALGGLLGFQLLPLNFLLVLGGLSPSTLLALKM